MQGDTLGLGAFKHLFPVLKTDLLTFFISCRILHLSAELQPFFHRHHLATKNNFVTRSDSWRIRQGDALSLGAFKHLFPVLKTDLLTFFISCRILHLSAETHLFFIRHHPATKNRLFTRTNRRRFR
ncbi:MAG: hypothetical protein EOM46_04500 [Gammaproteobacteria bacterium]|nr:hypothetical protein [Gammaproteobacteria bacterium]